MTCGMPRLPTGSESAGRTSLAVGRRVRSKAGPCTLLAAYEVSQIDRDELSRCLEMLRRRKSGKYLWWSFDEQTEEFRSTRNAESIAADERPDGL